MRRTPAPVRIEVNGGEGAGAWRIQYGTGTGPAFKTATAAGVGSPVDFGPSLVNMAAFYGAPRDPELFAEIQGAGKWIYYGGTILLFVLNATLIRGRLPKLPNFRPNAPGRN